MASNTVRTALPTATPIRDLVESELPGWFGTSLQDGSLVRADDV